MRARFTGRVKILVTSPAKDVNVVLRRSAGEYDAKHAAQKNALALTCKTGSFAESSIHLLPLPPMKTHLQFLSFQMKNNFPALFCSVALDHFCIQQTDPFLRSTFHV